MVIVSYSFFSYAMEQNPLLEIEKNQECYNDVNGCAEKILNTIDIEILEVNKDNWFRDIMRTYYSNYKISSLKTLPDIIQTLNIIESYMPLGCQNHELILSALMNRHMLATYLINTVRDDEVKQLQEVMSYTIDNVLNETRKIPNLFPLMNTFIRNKALERYKNDAGLNQYITTIPFDAKQEIHFIPLFGHNEQPNLEKGRLLMSSDSKYLRAIDTKGIHTVWSMETGKVINNIDVSDLHWTRYNEGNHHCAAQRVIDKDGNYCATIGMALAFGSDGIHKIQNKIKQKGYSFPVIMLFVRPTIESHVCQNIFDKSRGDKKALEVLLESETFKKVKGFPSTNLKYLIEQELLKIQQAKL